MVNTVTFPSSGASLVIERQLYTQSISIGAVLGESNLDVRVVHQFHNVWQVELSTYCQFFDHKLVLQSPEMATITRIWISRSYNLMRLVLSNPNGPA